MCISGCTLSVFIADVDSEEFVEKNKIHVPLSSTLQQLKERLAMVCFFSFYKRLGIVESSLEELRRYD